MQARIVVLGTLLALAFIGAPALAPALDAVSPVGQAEARPPCVVGPDGCVIPMYCFTEPCPSYP